MISGEAYKYARMRAERYKSDEYYIEGVAVRNIAYVMHILYQDLKLSADDTRDLANILYANLNHLVEVSEPIKTETLENT